LARVEAFMAEEFGYISIQATQPHTLAVAAYGEVGGHRRRSAGTLRDEWRRRGQRRGLREPGDGGMVNGIRATGLVKRYGDVTALDGVDLTVPVGTVLALLGPNGAGKTTVVRILTTLLRPDAGEAEVAGVDVLAHPRDVRRSLGLSGQYAAVDEYLTGFENLDMIGRLYHLGRRRSRERARELLAQFDLADAADRPAKTYSGGMRRRLDLAGALVADPPVLFLDEPTTGLDPRSRTDMWTVIQQLVSGGTTLLLTTQYLEEADLLANEIVVIDHGRVIAKGTADQLKAQVGGERLEVTVTDPNQLRPVSELLAPLGVGEASIDEHRRSMLMPVPMAPSAVLAGRTLSDVVNNVIVLVVMSLTGLAVGWRIRTSALEALWGFVLLLVFAYAISWVMAWIGLLVPSPEVVNNASFIVIFPLTFVANTFVPLGTLPGPLRAFAEWNPVSAVTQAARNLFGNPDPNPNAPAPTAWSLVHPELYTLLWAAAVLLIFVPLANAQYRRSTSR